MECTECKGSEIEEVYGGHGSVIEFPCSNCRPNAQEVLRLRVVEEAAHCLAEKLIALQDTRLPTQIETNTDRGRR